MCSTKIKLDNEAVKWLYWIWYTNKETFKTDNLCGQICDETSQITCEILNHFDILDNNKILKENQETKARTLLLLEKRNNTKRNKLPL